jgi:hypothetical protein
VSITNWFSLDIAVSWSIFTVPKRALAEFLASVFFGNRNHPSDSDAQIQVGAYNKKWRPSDGDDFSGRRRSVNAYATKGARCVAATITGFGMDFGMRKAGNAVFRFTGPI